MIKKQTAEIMQAINGCYPQFEVTQAKLDFWHKILEEYDFTMIETALLKYVRDNDYPPKINQLIQGINKPDKAYLVPNKEETKELIKRWEEEDAAAAEIAPSRDEIAEILKETAGEDFLNKVLKRGKKR